MSRPKPVKAGAAPSTQRELVEQVGLQVRKMGAQSVLLSAAVAERFGVNSKDLEVLDLVSMQSPVTAGALATATGLTTGAVTALIDRLEAAGYVERRADADDRRKVLVQVREKAIAPIQAVYDPIQAVMFKLWGSYSAKDLAVILDFLTRSGDLAVGCIERIRESPKPARR